MEDNKITAGGVGKTKRKIDVDLMDEFEDETLK